MSYDPSLLIHQLLRVWGAIMEGDLVKKKTHFIWQLIKGFDEIGISYLPSPFTNQTVTGLPQSLPCFLSGAQLQCNPISEYFWGIYRSPWWYCAIRQIASVTLNLSLLLLLVIRHPSLTFCGSFFLTPLSHWGNKLCFFFLPYHLDLLAHSDNFWTQDTGLPFTEN